jgi:ABC-type uncharacterized transport system substrate-binding protein
MKAKMITELVNFKALETTTDEQLILKVDLLNEFQKKQDGFIDAELLKDVKENAWCIIYHYESFEKLQAIGEKLRASKEFDEFISLIFPKNLSITFYHQVSMW